MFQLTDAEARLASRSGMSYRLAQAMHEIHASQAQCYGVGSDFHIQRAITWRAVMSAYESRVQSEQMIARCGVLGQS